MSKSNLFPQFTRFFSALLLWSALGVMILVNVLNTTRYTPNVLGSQTEENTKQAQALYQYWHTVIREKPDYRDAYIHLAALAYQLSEDEMMTYYLGILNQLDPNNKVVIKLLKLPR